MQNKKKLKKGKNQNNKILNILKYSKNRIMHALILKENGQNVKKNT